MTYNNCKHKNFHMGFHDAIDDLPYEYCDKGHWEDYSGQNGATSDTDPWKDCEDFQLIALITKPFTHMGIAPDKPVDI